MATIEWRGRRYPLVLCRRVGSRLTFRCRHCSKAKGEPVHHDHGWSPILPRHDFAMCEDPSSPYHRTGYVLAIEPPRTREELTRRIGRVLVQHIRGSGEAHLQLTLGEIHYLTEMLVDRLSDPRWSDTRTVAEILRGERGFERLQDALWNNSALKGVGL